MPPFAAVIFDNDGLLLDTEPVWFRAEQALFARRDRTFTRAHQQEMLGSSRAAGARRLEAMLDVPGTGFALMDELHELVMEAALGGVSPRPGATALLERLQAAGIPLGLATNSQREFAERTLTAAGVLADGAGPFGAIVSADEVEHAKPAPDLYLEVARRLGHDARACAALEDSPPGVAAASAAGMFVIGVPYFAGADLPGADLLAETLAAPEVAVALGLA